MKTRCGFGRRNKKIQENETSTCSFFQCYLFYCFHLQILLHGMLKGWKLTNPAKWPLGALRPIKNYLENTLDDLKESIHIFSQLTMEFVPTSLNKIWDITKRVISYFRLFQAYLFSDTSKFWLLPQRIDWEGWKWQGGIKTRSADDAVLKGSYKYTNDLTDIGQSWFVIVLHNPTALNSSCWN